LRILPNGDKENNVDTPISNFEFQRMGLILILRDFFLPPEDILTEADIQPGFQVLDYGCGVGSYTLAAARLVGPKGKIYALDIHSMALQRVKKAARKKGFHNIETIQSHCITQLESNSLDAILFYYVLHWLNDPDSVLRELRRVLKLGALLSFRDSYMKEDEILPSVTGRGWFRLLDKKKKTYRFVKQV
jgi:ubiquinone/menaquinone biosynthesis C-methylase UbiE